MEFVGVLVAAEPNWFEIHISHRMRAVDLSLDLEMKMQKWRKTYNKTPNWKILDFQIQVRKKKRDMGQHVRDESFWQYTVWMQCD